MDTKKLFLATTVGLAMSAAYVAEVPATAQTTTFSDVPTTNSHYKGITELAKSGIVTGVSATKFEPYKNATRGEAALFLANALKLDTKNVKNPNFKDVPTSSPYYGAIAALQAKGIIGGYSDGTFKPAASLTRSQFAKMLTLGFELDLAPVKNSAFIDVNSIKDAATKQYILTLVEYSITTGTTPTTFSPTTPLKRGQVATFLYKSMAAVADEFKVISVE